MQLRDWHFFRHFLQDANPHTPQEIERYVEAWSRPERGRDDQLLPRLDKTVPEGSRGKARAIGADTGDLGIAIPTSARTRRPARRRT